jgi:hypothetical protein
VGSKNIRWNTKGEGLVKGGIILFDSKGKPRYAYKEEMGVDLPVQDIVIALESIRREAATGTPLPTTRNDNNP